MHAQKKKRQDDVILGALLRLETGVVQVCHKPTIIVAPSFTGLRYAATTTIRIIEVGNKSTGVPQTNKVGVQVHY